MNIVVVVRGGLVDGVYAKRRAVDMSVTVIDFDIEEEDAVITHEIEDQADAPDDVKAILSREAV